MVLDPPIKKDVSKEYVVIIIEQFNGVTVEGKKVFEEVSVIWDCGVMEAWNGDDVTYFSANGWKMAYSRDKDDNKGKD